MAKSHSINVRVYYKDTDAGGVVYHTRYAEFMEMARSELLRAAGMPVLELKEEYNVFSPVVKLTLEYKKPAVLDDMVKIKANVTEITKDRITIEYELSNQFGDLLCTASTTNVCVSQDNFSIVNLPQELIDKLQ